MCVAIVHNIDNFAKILHYKTKVSVLHVLDKELKQRHLSVLSENLITGKGTQFVKYKFFNNLSDR